MPFFNETINSYECYQILEQGPCEPKYWFVLDPKAPNQATCAEQACACGNPQYDYEDDSCFPQYDDYDENKVVYKSVMFNGKCAPIEDHELCPRGQIVFPNTFGIGKFREPILHLTHI